MFPFDELLYFCLYYLFKLLYFLKAYYIGVLYLIKEWSLKLFKKSQCFTFEVTGSKYAVITGANQGIGLEVIKQLLQLKVSVTIGALMSGEECLNFENTLRTQFPHSKVTVWPLNLKSMQSVKKFAERYLRTSQPLHLLINNAGVMYVPYETTDDGFEHHMSVNYFSHCLLTKLLLPRLIESGLPSECARIINTSSSTHYVGDINMEDLHSKERYSATYCYLQSKLAVVLFTLSLQKYLQDLKSNVTVNCLHPGIVNTALYKHVFWAKYVGPHLFKTPEEGSKTIVYCALSKEMEGVGGKYLEECEIVQSSAKARDATLQRTFWNTTWKELDRWLSDTAGDYL